MIELKNFKRAFSDLTKALKINPDLNEAKKNLRLLRTIQEKSGAKSYD